MWCNYYSRQSTSKNTSITLGSYFDEFIQGILGEGRYKNASDVVCEGLRLLEAVYFDPDEHLKLLKANRK